MSASASSSSSMSTFEQKDSPARPLHVRDRPAPGAPSRPARVRQDYVPVHAPRRLYPVFQKMYQGSSSMDSSPTAPVGAAVINTRLSSLLTSASISASNFAVYPQTADVDVPMGTDHDQETSAL